MTMFDDRERAAEAKFVHAEEYRFRLTARRDKLFAHWTADRLGLSKADSAALVAAALHVPDRPGHDAALIAQIAAVLAERHRPASDTELQQALQHCTEQAAQQLEAIPLDHPEAP